MLSKCLVLFIGWYTVTTNTLLLNTCSKPPNFPSTIPLQLTNYENWDTEQQVKQIWTAIPSSAGDVVILANWAKDNNYKLRASGSKHTFAPLTVISTTTPCSSIILVNTTNKLNQIKMEGNSNLVTAQTGASMDNLLEFLELNGYGFYNVPLLGDVTVGGMLAINGHGTSIPAIGEALPSGHDYGSMSNKIVNITAVVWDQATSKYVLKSFHRTDPESSAFLVHLGRAFITDVTLQAGEDYNMRCQSYTNITASELFGTSSSGNTVSSFLDKTGRLEIRCFAFTDTPWVILRSLSPTQPQGSRKVTTPYNYPIFDSTPKVLSNLITLITNGGRGLSPLFGQTSLQVLKAGLLLYNSSDLWGKSKNLMLYLKPTSIRTTVGALVVQTRRSNIQTSVNKIYTFYNSTVSRYAQNGKYPSNFGASFRFTGLDTPFNNGWTVPGISAIRPLKSDTPFDVAIWFSVNPLPNSPYFSEFMTEIEAFFFQNFNDENAAMTVEWSKKYAFTSTGAHTNSTILNGILPKTLESGWKLTVNTLNKYDPHRIFSNSYLDSLLFAQ